MALFHRLFRLLIFVLGVATGVIATLFAIDNRNTIAITLWNYTFHVQVYLLALVPLAAGLAIGWLYTVPARTAEFADHWRQWRALRQMEKENKQLRKSLDKVLELPDDEVTALPQRDVKALPTRDERLEAEPVVVHEVKPAASSNGKARRPAAQKEAPPAEPAPRRRARPASTSSPATTTA